LWCARPVTSTSLTDFNSRPTSTSRLPNYEASSHDYANFQPSVSGFQYASRRRRSGGRCPSTKTRTTRRKGSRRCSPIIKWFNNKGSTWCQTCNRHRMHTRGSPTPRKSRRHKWRYCHRGSPCSRKCSRSISSRR